MKDKSLEYKNIFKSTFLFGFVQVFNILVKVLLNKAAAIFLGVEGIGLIGIFQSTSQMLKTFFGLGVNQSAVRDISKANKDGNRESISYTIQITYKIIWVTALVGALVTAILSSYLSIFSFGNDKYSSAFIILSIVVLFNILLDGQLGILKGMRELRSLAKASILGSASGLVVGVPLYYFWGNDGVVPTLLAIAISSVCFSALYVRKINYIKLDISLKDAFEKSSTIIKMGIALMFVSFSGMVSEYIIKVYIASNSDVATVGIYQAGLTIVSGYFSIIIVAMMTDYYPRISAVFDINEKLTLELNRQAKVGLILITPLIVAFMFLMPFFIQILYSDDFLMASKYMRYAIFWTLIIIVSNPIDMILIAKQNTKVFLLATIIYRVLGVLISIYSFDHYGLEGLGVSMLIMGVFHITLMQGIMYKLYRISIDVKTFKMFIVSIVFVLLSFFISDISDFVERYILGGIIISLSLCYSVKHFNEVTDLNIYNFIKLKLKRKS